jgi:hypothetical protein
VAAFDHFQSGFTFADAALTQDQNTLAIYLDEDTMHGHARRQFDIQVFDDG